MGYRVAERKPELKVLYFVIVPPIKMIDTCKPKYLFCRLLYKLIRTITTGICFLSILARRFQTVILMLIQFSNWWFRQDSLYVTPRASSTIRHNIEIFHVMLSNLMLS